MKFLAPALVGALITLLVLAITTAVNWTIFRQREGNDLREFRVRFLRQVVNLCQHLSHGYYSAALGRVDQGSRFKQ